jgi:hypothetical protein
VNNEDNTLKDHALYQPFPEDDPNELIVLRFGELLNYWKQRGAGLLNEENLDRVLRKYDIPARFGEYKTSYRQYMKDPPLRGSFFGPGLGRDVLKFALLDIHRFEDDHRDVMAVLGVAPRPARELVDWSNLSDPEPCLENQSLPPPGAVRDKRIDDELVNEFKSYAKQNPADQIKSDSVREWCQQAALAVNQRKKATKQKLYDALLASEALKDSCPSRSLFFKWLAEVNDQNPEDRRWKGRGRPLGSRKSKKQ